MDKRFWNRAVKKVASTQVFFWSLAWLIVLLVVGTIVQAQIGLYQAQDIYFSSWVIFAFGFVPVPGTMSILALMTVALALRVFMDDWTWPKFGTILVHFSALVLLIGGFVTAQFSEEGAVILAEGDRSAVIRDYVDLELVVLSDASVIHQFEGHDLTAGRVLRGDDMPFVIEVEGFAINGAPSFVDGVMGLEALPRLIEEEENISGVSLLVGAEGSEVARYVVFEGAPLESADGEYRLELRHKQRSLPFEIELIDFERGVYAGTNNAKDYHSDVLVRDGDVEWRSRIGMNEPLRYRGYTFYQSSFLQDDIGELTVLAAVKNAGRLFPYIASILLAVGLLVHLFQRLPVLMKRSLVVFLVLIFGFNTPAFAQGQAEFDMSVFAELPVLHEGRVKPIDSFARHYLKQFSGRENLGKMEAVDWISAVIFVPEIARELPIFRVRDPDVLHAINMPWEGDKKRYSFAELRTAMRGQEAELLTLEEADFNALNDAQQSVLKLQEDLLLYIDLSHSLSVSSEGLSRSFPASLFQVIPLSDTFGAGEWASPWMMSAQDIEQSEALNIWGELGTAYRDQDADAWARFSGEIQMASSERVNEKLLAAEVLYNRLKLHHVSLYFYVMAGLVLLVSLVGGGAVVRRVGLGFLTGGLLVHVLAIAMRMGIMERPPVTSLYESILFVGVIVVLFSVLFEWRYKNGLGVVMGSASGALLQLIGISYAADDGGTMNVLVPVLNTNFWLATHVVVITIGYGACVVTGLLAHAGLYFAARGMDYKVMLRAVMGFGLIALFFSMTGTILGGIWADQSWGRFWGWDPKENGALLICLWLIMMLHGRLAGILSPLMMLGGMAILISVVALAWFGVNLLNVGLHSYGFTDGIAVSLFSFVAVQILVITICMMVVRFKRGVS